MTCLKQYYVSVVGREALTPRASPSLKLLSVKGKLGLEVDNNMLLF